MKKEYFVLPTVLLVIALIAIVLHPGGSKKEVKLSPSELRTEITRRIHAAKNLLADDAEESKTKFFIGRVLSGQAALGPADEAIGDYVSLKALFLDACACDVVSTDSLTLREWLCLDEMVGQFPHSVNNEPQMDVVDCKQLVDLLDRACELRPTLSFRHVSTIHRVR